MSYEQDVKRRQSLFRKTLLSDADCQVSDASRRHGHVLPLGRENQSLYPLTREMAIEFIDDRRIKWWQQAVVGDTGNSPSHNLASSQVCCINYFLPLAQMPSALTDLIRGIDDDVYEILPIRDPDDHQSFVELEWVGYEGPLEPVRISRGEYQTSVDAFVVARTVAGKNRAYLIEWKYSEGKKYLNGPFLGEGKQGETRRKWYLHLFEQDDSPFHRDASYEWFLYEPYYQIMRLFLLAAKTVREGVTLDLPVHEARVLIICPEANETYRTVAPAIHRRGLFENCQTVQEAIRSGLKIPEHFRIVDQETLTGKLRDRAGNPQELEGWLQYQSERYGW